MMTVQPPIPRIGTFTHMGRNTSFSLDEHFSAFIEDEVASGRYSSASDVVRSALRTFRRRSPFDPALLAAIYPPVASRVVGGLEQSVHCNIQGVEIVGDHVFHDGFVDVEVFVD